MNLVPISRADDPRLDVFRLNERQLFPRDQRRDPAEHGLFVAEGDLVVERAFAAGCEPVALLCSERYAESLGNAQCEVFVGDIETRREVTGLGVPLDALGVFRRPAPTEIDRLLTHSRRLVALEAVDNPTNVGSVVRSASALGWDGLLLDWTCADPFARRALRVAMGTSFSLAHTRAQPDTDIIDAMSRAGLTTVALTPNPEADDIRDVAQREEIRRGRVAIILGAERTGLSTRALDGSKIRVRIPMHAGVDSLNIATAAAIALFALA